MDKWVWTEWDTKLNLNSSLPEPALVCGNAPSKSLCKVQAGPRSKMLKKFTRAVGRYAELQRP